MNEGSRQELKFTVATDAEAHELTAAWREIITGKLPRLNSAAADEDGIMERARVGLQRIIMALEDHPGSGQSAKLVRFLAGMYNGHDYPFDLTGLRGLDTDLASACIDYLNYDRLGKAEVHTHLTGRGERLESWFDDVGLLPQPHLVHRDSQGHRLWCMSKRLRRGPDELLKRAVEAFLTENEQRAFSALKAPETSSDGEDALIHAGNADSATPLCGARDGPWSTRAFQCAEITCYECRSVMLQDAMRTNTP